MICALRIAHAPIIYWIQLSEIADQDHRNVPEEESIGVQSPIAEEASFPLLHAEMHPRKERTANKGDLIHDQELNVAPRALQTTQGVAFQFTFPLRLGEDLKGRARRLSPKANVKGGHTCIRRELDLGVYLTFLKEQTQVLHDGPKCGGLAAASGAT